MQSSHSSGHILDLHSTATRNSLPAGGMHAVSSRQASLDYTAV